MSAQDKLSVGQELFVTRKTDYFSGKLSLAEYVKVVKVGRKYFQLEGGALQRRRFHISDLSEDIKGMSDIKIYTNESAYLFEAARKKAKRLLVEKIEKDGLSDISDDDLSTLYKILGLEQPSNEELKNLVK